MKVIREVKQIVNGLKTSDGDGVQLTRIIGSADFNMLDPFLLFDAFGSDKPQDYIGGFPSHPHRGFETVTYMIAGKMRHKDSAGNEGVIEKGGVQWMTAGKGVIHSEMPEQEAGLLAGFQLWINLPALHKMDKPKYQEKTEQQVPSEKRADGSSLKVIAGETRFGTLGVIENSFVAPIFWDVCLSKNGKFEDEIPENHNAFIYMMKGKLKIGDLKKEIEQGQLAVLELGSEVLLESQQESRFLVIAAKPLNEAVVRGGPFVMNTQQQIHQAFEDYQSGKLT